MLFCARKQKIDFIGEQSERNLESRQGRQPLARGGATKSRNPGLNNKTTGTPNAVSGCQKAKLRHKASHYAAHSPCSGLRYYFRFTRGSAAKRLHPGLRLYRPTGSKLRALRAPEQIDKLLFIVFLRSMASANLKQTRNIRACFVGMNML